MDTTAKTPNVFNDKTPGYNLMSRNYASPGGHMTPQSPGWARGHQSPGMHRGPISPGNIMSNVTPGYLNNRSPIVAQSPYLLNSQHLRSQNPFGS